MVDVSAKIYNAVRAGSGTEFDIWLDYISVPQWSPDIKSMILSAIPTVYQSATFTVAHLADLDPKTVQLLKEGQSTQERLEGITGICNSAWLRRVWTASEFVRSLQVRVVDKNHQLLDDAGDPVFYGAMMKVWNQELTRHSVHALETMARHGHNLVPWNLSALFHIKQLRLADFAHAFSLLSSRGCIRDSDFMFALNGIVRSQADLTHSSDPNLAYVRIAKSCLENGDYSPLIMTPELGGGGHDPRDHMGNARAWALNDVFTWGMGTAVDAPTHASDIRFDELDPILTLAEIGTVTMLQYNNPRNGPPDQFMRAAAFVLETTGPHVDDFVASLGTTLYNENTDEMHDHIANSRGRQWLQDLLHRRHTQHRGEMWPWDGDDGALAVRDCLGLADHRDGARPESPVDFLNGHGNTLHLHNRNHMIRVRCNSCDHESTFRAALFRTPEFVQGATAYRVPGLRYDFTRRDGVGMLVRDGTIVGRMIWAVPSCPCAVLASVKVRMPRLPRRRPLF